MLYWPREVILGGGGREVSRRKGGYFVLGAGLEVCSYLLV